MGSFNRSQVGSKSVSLFAILLVFLSTACSPTGKNTFSPNQGAFVLSKKPPFKISRDQEYTFGYLQVPENRNVLSGKTLKLPVYIFKSRSPNPQPDPIVYTVGGPGSTTMPSAQYMKYYSYLEDRDFILFEQRGTAYANPHLDCPEWAEAVRQSNLPGCDAPKAKALLDEAAARCKARLIGDGHDLNGYRTREIAADLADLKKALGLDQYNLLTISYSTKIAQVMLRDHPEGIRSVVMDSPLPLEVNYDEESVGNLLEVAEKLLSDCEQDPACNSAFPRLKVRFFNFLEEATENPLEVVVDNPQTGKQETFYLRGRDLIAAMAMGSTSEVPEIPMQVNKLLEGDLSLAKENLASLFEAPGNGAGMGMRLSVWCAEEFPFVSQDIVASETSHYPALQGLSPSVFDSSTCRIWGVVPEPALENQPISSEVPILLLSGSYDNETPEKWAAAMDKHLPNSYHLVFNGWSHTVTTNWSNPCGMEVARAFFNDPSQRPQVPCFEELPPPTFRLK